MLKLDEKIEFQPRGNDILTIGEILIDMISEEYSPADEPAVYHNYFGGSPANIAMNVKRLGIRSLVASAVGEDRLGTFLISHLRKTGIDPGLVQRVDSSTSMVVVAKSKGTPDPIFYRGADYQLQYTEELEKALLDSKIVHFSCWPLSMAPARHTIEKVIEQARSQNILVCLDPNYHQMVWKKGAEGIEYVKSIIGMVDIIKPSEDDAERLFGKGTHENQIRKFLDLGAKLVILTIGKDGAIVSNGEDTFRIKPLATDVIDTTGAGDAFWSGFYTALVKGFSVKEALELGSAASAYKLKFTGAVCSMPPLEQLKEMYGL